MQTRNVYTIAERRDDLIRDVKSLILDTSTEAKVLAVINNRMNTKGSTSEKVAPITVGGETMYYCTRFDKYFPLECMVLNSKGEPLTYSKESVKVLTQLKNEYKAKSKELIDGITKAIENGDFETAQTLTNEKRQLVEPTPESLSSIAPEECRGYTLADAD